MTGVARLAGAGVVTALGAGQEANLSGLRQGQGLYRTRRLHQFDEPIDAPYLAVESSVTDNRECGDAAAQATAHMQWLLDCAVKEALSNADLSAELNKEIRAEIPVFIGSSSYGIGLGEALYEQAIANEAPASPVPLDGFTQIGNHLRRAHGFTGPDFAFNTACTASANALLSATNAIVMGQRRYALVVGMETYNTTTLAGFYGMQLLADEVMRPFDQQRNGLVLGEGCAVLLLELAEPGSNGLTVCGGASQCDTYSISASNPDGSSIAEVMQHALEKSRIDASEILAIKAHGTASPLNDDGEAAGMRRVFSSVPPFFSLKSYIGHTLGGCGAIEMALLAASLKQQEIPASAGFESTDESLGVSPISQSQSADSGYYMANFFGFGGNNCSLVIHIN